MGNPKKKIQLNLVGRETSKWLWGWIIRIEKKWNIFYGRDILNLCRVDGLRRGFLSVAGDGEEQEEWKHLREVEVSIYVSHCHLSVFLVSLNACFFWQGASTARGSGSGAARHAGKEDWHRSNVEKDDQSIHLWAQKEDNNVVLYSYFDFDTYNIINFYWAMRNWLGNIHVFIRRQRVIFSSLFGQKNSILFWIKKHLRKVKV